MKKYFNSQFISYKKRWSMTIREAILRHTKVKIDGFDKWKCNHCQRLFAKSEVQVDHIIPVNKAPNTKEEFLNAIDLNESDKLQIICYVCHKIKSKEENIKRKKDKYIEDIWSICQNNSLGYFINDDMTLSDVRKVCVLLKKYDSEKNSTKKEKHLKKYELLLQKKG